MDLSSLEVPSYIRDLKPYVPGKPIEETRREFRLKRVVKLASNENPLGPSPKALQAIVHAKKELHRYPDSGAYELKRDLSRFLKVKPEQLTIGNGSNEIIDLLIRAVLKPGDQILTSQAAFVAYRICAQVHGVETLETPLTSDLRFDLSAMAEVLEKQNRVRMVFIANPNNPTGTYVNGSEIRTFLNRVSQKRPEVLVVIDAAYWEYVTAKDLPDALELLKDFPQVVVLRTFSKAYGLAGLRVGYGVADPQLISILERIRNPFNVNSLALAGAAAALKDQTFVRKAKTTNQKERKRWEKFLKELKVPYWESQGNFILIDTQKGWGLSGVEVYEKGLREGVILRPVANYGLSHALRISIGKPSENEIAFRFLRKLKRWV